MALPFHCAHLLSESLMGWLMWKKPTLNKVTESTSQEVPGIAIVCLKDHLPGPWFPHLYKWEMSPLDFWGPVASSIPWKEGKLSGMLLDALYLPATSQGSAFTSLPFFFFPDEETHAHRVVKCEVTCQITQLVRGPVQAPASQRHRCFVLHLTA